MKLKRIHFEIFSYVFIIVSILFLLRYLSSQNLLQLPGSLRWPHLSASLFLLLGGFYLNCLGWKLILRNNKINISVKDSVISLGSSIFGKYIPGKVWLIAGISGRVAAVSGASVLTVSMIATLLQVLIILTGVVVGAVSLTHQFKPGYTIAFYVLVFVLLVVFCKYKGKIYDSSCLRGSEFARKWIRPLLSSISLPVLASIMGMWVFWALAFYLLCNGLGLADANLLAAFTFPLASTLGILAIFAPGGLGVREGLLGILLSGYLANTKDIATLAAVSRLWFLSGETGMFIVASILMLINWRKHRRIN